MHSRIVPIVLAALAFAACEKKKEEGDSTYAQLAVANSSTLRLTQAGTYTPSVFEVKLIDVRIMQELDSTKHPAPVIWYNSECGTSSTTETEVDGKTYEYTQSPGCDIDKITNYFDFARPTEEVNAELNSQPNKVYPETYKFVSMAWCESASPTDNVRFQADGMSEPLAGGSGGCGTISAEAVPPLEIGEGDTVTISLDYSIDGMISDQSGEFCYEEGDVKRCFNMPKFVPSVVKND